MKLILESERLWLREFTLDDAGFILRLLNDPTWIAFIGDRQVYSLEDARDYLRKGALASYAAHGFGPGLMVVKDTGAEVGMCGLFKRTFLEDIDLGFALLPEYTGMGYARELAESTLKYAIEILGYQKVAAFSDMKNIRSRHLLHKIGFRDAGYLQLEGETLYLLIFP